MLTLKYFLTVGSVLMIGLFALSSYMESEKVARPRTHSTATLAVAPPPPPKAAAPTVSLIDEQLPPPPETRGRGNRR